MSAAPAVSPPSLPPPLPAALGLSLCVLASGSAGNCSALVWRAGPGSPRRVVLLDAGLSPRRTAVLLAERGIRVDEVDDIVFTHLDTDHCHAGWGRAIRPGGWRARLRVHRRHMGRAGRMGLLFRHTEPFGDDLPIDDSLSARVCVMSHDSLGVAAFRFEAESAGQRTHLGYATDLGHVTNELTAMLAGVDVLAIESNYCPRMQVESDRPEFLKRRIMGGGGHLSNAESADAAAEIGPAGTLVLLHLSRQCNTPEKAMAAHARVGRPVVISAQTEATGWITARACAEDGTAGAVVRTARFARSLFEAPTGGRG